MRFKQSRTLSFCVIAAVYILAAAVGIFIYLYLPFAFWLNLLIADVLATFVVFVFSVMLGNASVYDPYWSVQPIVILAAFFLSGKFGAAQLLPFVAVLVWGVRLTGNWAYTFENLEWQDWRYTQLKEQTGIFYPIVNFVGIHLMPTLVVYGCVMPAVCVFVLGGSLNAGSVIFFAVSLCAVVLQAVSDLQMHSFRKKKTGGFIREGFWKYSRHPNYLGEILFWWGIGLLSVCSLAGRWYLLLGALVNTLLFTFVSIPLAEGKQSKKSGFAEYKKATRVLLPIKK